MVFSFQHYYAFIYTDFLNARLIVNRYFILRIQFQNKILKINKFCTVHKKLPLDMIDNNIGVLIIIEYVVYSEIKKTIDLFFNLPSISHASKY